MTAIKLTTVRHIAKLSHLRFSALEEERLREELGDILGFIEVLDELPDHGAIPEASATPLREDRVSNRARAEELLAGAPDREALRFRVPAMLGG